MTSHERSTDLFFIWGSTRTKKTVLVDFRGKMKVRCKYFTCLQYVPVLCRDGLLSLLLGPVANAKCDEHPPFSHRPSEVIYGPVRAGSMQWVGGLT